MDTGRVLLDDRLLIERILAGGPGPAAARPGRDLTLCTTSLWWFRACRGAVLGAGGQLSGPFGRAPVEVQERAIAHLLTLPPEIELPDQRATVPAMAAVARRHPRLNLLNLEAAAAAATLEATVWLSPPAADGVLPGVLDAEALPWKVVAPR